MPVLSIAARIRCLWLVVQCWHTPTVAWHNDASHACTELPGGMMAISIELAKSPMF
jgi:hypothetical protein